MRCSGYIVPALLIGAAAGCATDRWTRMQAEFADVRANCRLRGTDIELSGRDRRLIHLVFPQRNNEAVAAADDGRLACARHWAEERGYRLTTEPKHGEAD